MVCACVCEHVGVCVCERVVYVLLGDQGRTIPRLWGLQRGNCQSTANPRRQGHNLI